MIMDEATANMDQDTDMYVTNKIRETFNKSTTFTIAHRLATIANYDKVLVLDKGSIKEFDAPYKLLVKKIGDDTITNTEGHFTSMVNNTGPITSKHIFEIAQNAYYEKNNMGQGKKKGEPEQGPGVVHHKFSEEEEEDDHEHAPLVTHKPAVDQQRGPVYAQAPLADSYQAAANQQNPVAGGNKAEMLQPDDYEEEKSADLGDVAAER